MTQLVDLKSRNLSSDSSGSLSLKSVSLSGNEGVSRTGCALKALRIVPFLPLPAPGGWQGARLMAASLSSVFKRERDCLLCLSSLPSVCFLKHTWCIWGQAGQSGQSPLNTLVLITSPADEMHLTPVGFTWVGLAQGLACSKYSMNANFWWTESICTVGEKYDGSFFIAYIFYFEWFFESKNCSVVYGSLQPHELHSPWNYPGQNTGVGGLSLLQGIFPTQGLNPGLLRCRQILHSLSQQGSPRILEWVAYPFSRGSSRPRDLNGVSHIAGRFFTSGTTFGWCKMWPGYSLFFFFNVYVFSCTGSLLYVGSLLVVCELSVAACGI